MTVPTWEQEYTRRVTQALTPDHYEHGFRPDKVGFDGEDGGAWSSWTLENPSLTISVSGPCPCGAELYEFADTPEEIAKLLRRITEPDAVRAAESACADVQASGQPDHPQTGPDARTAPCTPQPEATTQRRNEDAR